MEYQIERHVGGTTAATVISHKGQSLTFKATRSRNTASEPEQYYLPVNDYLKTLPEDVQDDLFQILMDAWELVNPPYSEDVDFVEGLGSALYNISTTADFIELEHWAKTYSKFHRPCLTENIGKYDPATTYTAEEYQDLMGLATAVKIIAPLWINGSEELARAVGKLRLELSLFEIVDGYTPLPEFDAWHRLQRYILGSIGEYETPTNITLAGIAHDQIPDLLMGEIIFRKLHTAETTLDEIKNKRGVSQRNNLAGVIKNFLTDQPKKFASSKFGSNIGEYSRYHVESAAGEEGNTSCSESLSTVQEYSDEYTEALSTLTNNRDDVIFWLDSTIDKNLVAKFEVHLTKHKFQNNDIKRTLMQPYISDAFTLVGLDYLNANHGYKTVIATLCARLHTWELYDLVKYLLSQDGGDSEHIDNRQHIAKNAKFTADIERKLAEAYPMVSAPVRQSFSGDKQRQVGMNAKDIISDIVSVICSKTLNENSPTGIKFESDDPMVTPYNQFATWYPQPNFKDLLAVYLIKVNKMHLENNKQRKDYN